MTIRHVLFAAPVVAPLVTLACMAAVPAAAQQVANPDPAGVRPGSYAVEPEHTQVEFGVLHLGFTAYYGRFSGASGQLRLSPTDPATDVLSVSVPTASVSTTSGKLDEELKGAEWFDAARFPQIAFASTAVTPTGPADATVAGNLTLHGVTRPVVLQAHFVGAGVNPLDGKYTVGFQVTGAIRRSEFGVTKYVPLVGDEVRLTISGAFERQG